MFSNTRARPGPTRCVRGRIVRTVLCLAGSWLAALAPAHAFESFASSTSRWSATFDTAPNCTGSGCHSMNRASFGPDDIRVRSTANSAQVSVSGTNGNYFWRYRSGSSASAVFSSPQQIGSLGSGVNNLDFCVLEVTGAGLGQRDWNCGDFEITKNRLPTVNLSQSSVALEVGDSEGVTVNATDDLPGLSYAAESNSNAVQVSGSGPGFTVRGSDTGSATVTFTVTDADGERSRREMNVSVTAAPVANQPPRIDNISPNPGSVEEGDSINVRVNASDDKPGLRYAALPGSSRITVTGSGPDFTLRGNGEGGAEVEFTVTDSDGATASQTLQVTVTREPSTDGGTDGTADGTTDGNTDGATDGTADGTADGSGGECIDTDPVGDGWGWDGSSSCRVDADGGGDGGGNNGGSGGAECVDTDPVGDGWGWDGSSSCRVDADGGGDGGGNNGGSGGAVCVDTDPVGDGWGWDGSSSCRVDADGGGDNGGSGGAVCVDTDPVGDGWGWDGSSSCRVGGDGGGDNGGSGGSGSAECVDTDPVGDGWGWDGSSSCRVESSGGFAGRSSDGQWPVCYTGVGLGSSEAWQVQTGVETGVAEACVKQCPGDYIRDQSFPGWGWNQALSTSCVESNAAAGSNTAVPVYVDGSRLSFDDNLSRNGLIRNGGSWSCQRQTRADAGVPFANSGQSMTLQFVSDGTLNAAGSSSATWSLSGRLLRLQTSPVQVYRNARFDGGQLHLYETTEVRYRCQ